jgi:hypothetical protein
MAAWSSQERPGRNARRRQPFQRLFFSDRIFSALATSLYHRAALERLECHSQRHLNKGDARFLGVLKNLRLLLRTGVHK